MKKLLLTILLTSTIWFCKAQSPFADTTGLAATNQRIDKIQFKLAKSQKEFRGGVVVWLLGTLVACGGAVASGDDPESASGLLIGGGALSLVGAVIMIDSHKWIGRAGK